jgi:hypothetical protein
MNNSKELTDSDVTLDLSFENSLDKESTSRSSSQIVLDSSCSNLSEENDYVDYLKLAIKEAKKGVVNKDGGPFGAVIVDNDGNIIATGHNMVLCSNDPTAHAEVTTIRKACKKLGRFDLSDCTIYTVAPPPKKGRVFGISES